MVKGWSIALGVGLAILGLAALGSQVPTFDGNTPWVAYADLLAAFISFVIAGTTKQEGRYSQGSNGSGPITLSIALFACWLIGLSAANVPSVLAWWNFAFGCAYAVVGINAFSETHRRRRRTAHQQSEEEQKHPPRRAA